MVNKVILLGNLGADPEIRVSQNGSKIATFSLATTESWKDKQSGERKTNTTWHRVVVFNPNLAEIVEKYVKKGSKLLIEGAIANRKYTDKDGIEKNISEVVISQFKGEITMVDSANRNNDADSSASYEDSFKKTETSKPTVANVGDDLDDEIPF